MDNLHKIESLYNTLYTAIATIDGGLSYSSITGCIIKLAELVAETETPEFFLQSVGEYNEFSLDGLIVGAFWHYTEWHAGQESIEYAAYCALNSVFSPGFSGGPEENTGEYFAYELLNDLAENACNK